MIAEDEQIFLEKQRGLLSRNDPDGGVTSTAPAVRQSPTSSASPATRVNVSSNTPPQRRRGVPPSRAQTFAGNGSTSSTPNQRASPATPNRDNNDVLANFFNSLLGNAGTPGAANPSAAGARADPGKEREKMKGKPE